jgi:hypothetical protein
MRGFQIVDVTTGQYARGVGHRLGFENAWTPKESRARVWRTKSGLVLSLRQYLTGQTYPSPHAECVRNFPSSWRLHVIDTEANPTTTIYVLRHWWERNVQPRKLTPPTHRPNTSEDIAAWGALSVIYTLATGKACKGIPPSTREMAVEAVKNLVRERDHLRDVVLMRDDSPNRLMVLSGSRPGAPIPRVGEVG